MSHSVHWALFAILVLARGSTAQAADKHERAQAVFDQACSLCHVFGRKPGDDPREKIVLDPAQKKWTDAWVRRWLEGPRVVNPDSICLGDKIDPVARDLLVSFLRQHNTPGARLASIRTGSGKVLPSVRAGAKQPPKQPPAGQKSGGAR